MSDTNKQRVKEAIGNFPATFGLRSFDGVFRISEESSFVADDGSVKLYTQRRVLTEDGEDWRDFAKTDAWELARNVTAVRCDQCHGDRIVDTNGDVTRCPRCKGTGRV